MKDICLLHALLLLSLLAHGQTRRTAVREQFVPREVVVFAEDFSQDPVGANPAGWWWMARHSEPRAPKEKMWVVEQTDVGKCLSIKTTYFDIYPTQNLSPYMRDSFTLSCEFFFATTFALSEISLMHKSDDPRNQSWENGVLSSFSIAHDGDLHTHIGVKREEMPQSEMKTRIIVDYPAAFDTAAWHQMGISYCKRHLKVYVDSFLMLSEPNYRYPIDTILFGGWATVKYRNIQIATGPEALPVRQLLTGRALSTHAILFDVGSASIKPGSYAFLDELVAVLQSRRTLKLEIHGHTDSDGSDADNLALSVRRANAVRDYLVTHGVAAARLSAKGFGETKPLRRGNSEQDKATNRRVEFVPK
jgi:OmpA-OmpF porin, OOP family